jgi:hypothetical protein
MMKRYDFAVVLCLVAPLFAVGCIASPEDVDDDIGTARSESISPNSISPNSISPNSISPNSISPNSLAPTSLSAGALATGSLSADALAAIQDPGSTGESSRLLLKYTVGCAFDTTQSLSFTWEDANGAAHEETYVGVMGLAPTWADGALSEDGQRWVSACLIARVNYFGAVVHVSLRGPMTGLGVTESEAATYTNQEGAFWGNIFSSTPTAYACDYVPNDAHSRSADRVCAAGYDDGSGTLQSCGIIQRVGSCADACGTLTSGLYYASCGSGGGQSSSSVVTVFLE